MSHSDQILRFIFDDLDIRGELVYLNESWQQILSRHDYPLNVRKQLGEALAAVALLSATIKIEGSLILQVQGQGPLRTLVAQANHEGEIRGLAKWQGSVPESGLDDIFGQGRLVMTARSKGAEPHQSVVALEGDSLAQALEHYFRHSEQLQSALWLFVQENQVAGLFLQQLPSRRFNTEDWQRVCMLADTITEQELMALPAETVLHRLFHEEKTRLFPPAAIRFACSCSAEKIESSLFTMGKQSLQEILDSEGQIKVDCEFCRQEYRFSQADIEQLFIIRGPEGRNIVH